jgi:predicted secreted protein
MVLVMAGLVGLWAMAGAAPDRCDRCKAQPHTKDIGECALCKGMTQSGQFPLCMDCSRKLKECERCRKPLAGAQAGKIDEARDGTYESGPWEYRYSVSLKGTRSEGYHGTLLHSGGPVPEPAGENDHYATPWGPLYWVGRPAQLFGGHGWMPRPRPSRPEGQRLPEPRPARMTVLVKVLTGGARGGKPVEEAWIRDGLAGMGVKEPAVARDWFPLGWDSVVLEDTKRYGRAVVRLRRSGADKPLVVETRNFDQPGLLTELPRQDGATKLVKHTVSSGVQSLDLFLALRAGTVPGAEPRWMDVGAESEGKSVEVRDVEQVILRLPGDAASGCSWSVKSIEGGSVKAGGGAEYVPGPAGIFEVPLRVAGTGKAEVVLEYGRSWEKDKPAEKTFRVTLEVCHKLPGGLLEK